MASGIYTFLLLDNDQKGGDPNNAFLTQYVRVWQLEARSGADGAVGKKR